VRSLFDQYKQPENRLTHALVCCLSEDKHLLHDFVRWVTGRLLSARQRVRIVEQTLPGEDEGTEEDAERRGLPDAWIHDEQDTWSLIIESKVSAAVSPDQLHRHRAMALRRGFKDPLLLVISPRVPSTRSLAGAKHLTWSDLYAWVVGRNGRTEWACRLVEYMEAAEETMTASGYLTAGTLTKFSGIHFDEDNPYSYREAKRLLGLTMDELRKDSRLQKMGMDPASEGRPAITGREGSAVWDFLSLTQASKATVFTQYPHLTLAVQRDKITVIVTVPHGIRTRYRCNLLDLGKAGFRELFVEIGGDLAKRLKTAKGAKPWMEILQRHYPSQRSASVVDCCLQFDLRTAISLRKGARGGDRQVKLQPQWLDAAFDALSHKKSNLQLGVGAVFPYGCPVLRSRAILDHIAGTWLACGPLLRTLLSEEEGSRGGKQTRP
jgi:hypothetical protein